MDLSIVIPVFNEEKNISILYKKLLLVLNNLSLEYEIIFIDDGSTDGSFDEVERICNQDKRVKGIKFRKNFGQTAAMDAGFKHVKGSAIISMDADLQNDPEDIPRLLAKMKEGYDVVCGWRYRRKDPFFKKLVSKLANSLRRFLSGEKIHDSGCSLRAYKKECFRDLDLYGEMHRFIPALLRWKGFKIGEIKVEHYQRKYGKTKYNYKRLPKGLLDLLNVLFWRKYSGRPLHIFGGFGVLMSLLGFFVLFVLIILRLMGRISLVNSTLPLLSILLIIVGIQFFVSGLLADIAIKNYYKNGRTTYSIEKIVEK